MNEMKNLKLIMFKMKIWLSGNDYRVAGLSESYQTTKRLIMQNLKSKG